MKVYKIEVIVLDFNNCGIEECKLLIENTRHIHPHCGDYQTIDIGEWDDDHPHNQNSTDQSKYFREVYALQSK